MMVGILGALITQVAQAHQRKKDDEMTKQEMFDKVLFGIRRQGKKSVNQSNACMYRGENDCKCVIGMLIDDTEYQSSWEGCSLSINPTTESCATLVNWFSSKFGKDMVDFGEELQACHDNSSKPMFIKAFEKNMSVLAVKYKLNYTTV